MTIMLTGIFWILIGILIVITRTMGTMQAPASYHTLLAFLGYSTISIGSIAIGIGFMLGKRWAKNAMMALSVLFIAAIWGLGGKMVLYGILDILKFKTPGSSVQAIFGLTVLLSSVPFLFVLSFINGEKVKSLFPNPIRKKLSKLP